MSKFVSKLIRFTETLVRSIRRARVPWFSCPKSKHTYRQYQHLAVLGLMKYLRSDYRGIVDQLHSMPGVMAALGMYQLPHWTTLQKFLQRFSRYRFDGLLAKTVSLFQCAKSIVAVDATGFSNDHASKYYAWRTGTVHRSYTRSTVAIDANSLCIAAQHSSCSEGQGGENTFFIPLVSRAASRLCISAVVADKAYDSEFNHEFVRQDIGAQCLIPVRRGWKNGTVKGYYRLKLMKQFNQRLYHRRSMVETVFSVMKRKFGSTVNSRLLPMQNKEAALLAVVYNVYRYVNTHTEALFCYVFYSALITVRAHPWNVHKAKIPARP